MQFANTGNSSASFSAVSGSVSTFNSSFRLVGDTADGGLQVTSPPFTSNSTSGIGNITSLIQTNVKSAVEQAIGEAGGPTSLYVRMDFNAANYTSLSTLTLKMQCADGYVAYLNGVEVASYNVPGAVTWNSQALEQQTSQVQATTYQDVDLTSFLSSMTTGHLTATGDVLAIQVLLSADTNTQMLVLPVLCQMSTALGPSFVFATPTPGTANALADAEPSITFSQVHGYFSSTFQVDLTSNIPGASIYYTTDNSVPTATNGTLYTGPITISTTTVLQAAIVVGGVASVYQTETYIFGAAVAAQPADPAGFPTAWDGTITNENVTADYAMSLGARLHDAAGHRRPDGDANDVDRHHQRRHVRPPGHLRQSR